MNSTYDALNRRTGLVDSEISPSGDFYWTFTYDKASRTTRLVYPSGLRTESAYNKADWVLGVYTNTSTPSVLESWTYTYDDVGNRLTMTENTGNVATYAYDNVYRLKSESYSLVGPTVNYTYDGVGNRLTEVRNGTTTTYGYDADNRMTSRGRATYAYDDNGNLIRKTEGGQNTTYAWDYGSSGVLSVP